MPSRLFPIVALILVTVPCLATESAILQSQSQHYSRTIRVQAFTENAVSVPNPVSWLPITSIAEDGAKVKKGEVITTFDRASSLFDLDSLKKKREVIQSELEERLAQIDNRELQMQDDLDTLEDRQAVLQAKLDRLRSQPLDDDIAIAAGRLHIAELNEQAAEKDLEKARNRFKREMISSTELERFEKQYRDKRALLIYAQNELTSTKTPPSPETLQELEMELANGELELERLSNELREYRKIAVIQKRGAASRLKGIERRIREKEEDIGSTVVQAPISGYISYSRYRDTDIALGLKMWKNYNYLKIPDMSTLAFRGTVLESVRKHFQPGDAVRLRLYGNLDQVIMGQVKSISTFSHDLAEKEEGSWGATNREFGVKVFDVVIVMSVPVERVYPGMVGFAEIISQEVLTGPAVPLKFLKLQEGKKYLALDGHFREVTGTLNQGWFIAADSSLNGKTVTMRGSFSPRSDSDSASPADRLDSLFSASGELVPISSLGVMIKDIGPWTKVAWLIPEETLVKKGDLIAKLDPKELDQRIEKYERRLDDIKGRSEELEKQRQLTRLTGEIKCQAADNQLKIQKLKLATVEGALDAGAIYQAELRLSQAQISLDSLAQQLQRQEDKPRPSLSPDELARLRRNRQRQELKVEEAQLRLDKLLRGADAVSRSQARLALMRQERQTLITRKNIEIENVKKDREYQRALLEQQRRQRRVDHLQRQRENLFIKSPGNGLIQYNKIWNSGALTKVNVGCQVGKRYEILSIPDQSRMYISVEIPEKYFSQVQKGLPVEVHIPSLSDRLLTGEVSSIDFILKNREKKSSQIGIYSSHEPLGEVVFTARINVVSKSQALKPGAVGKVYFPFSQSRTN
jgi:multidrug resistance efflux pump